MPAHISMWMHRFRSRSKQEQQPKSKSLGFFSTLSSSSSLFSPTTTTTTTSSSSTVSRPRYTAANPLEGTRFTSLTRRDQEKLAAAHDRLQARVDADAGGRGYYQWKSMSSRQTRKKEAEMVANRQMNRTRTVTDFRDVVW